MGRAALTPGEQLAAIRSLDEAMTRAGLDYALIGGWAVDFWVGAVTRPHDDVDAVVWRRDEDAIEAALEDTGWHPGGRSTDGLGTRFELGAVLLELTLLESGEGGSVLVPLPDRPFVFPASPFGGDRRELYGVSATLMPLELLRAGKSTPRDDDADAAKDRVDFEALSHVGQTADGAPA